MALPLFCKQIIFYNKAALGQKGPLILASNHPNSFLDAIILGAFMKQPVHFFTRGDVFGMPWVNSILKSLKMIPIFRIRDGKEKLNLNQQSFDAGHNILKKGGILLIFVEGFCENQTTLQLPLKKGAPRILVESWHQNIDAKVLPVWLQYSSFVAYGKTIHLHFGQLFGKEITLKNNSEAQQITAINKATEAQLLALSQGIEKQKKVQGFATMLWPIALFAKGLHWPFYRLAAGIVKAKSKDNVHYDSILLASLCLGYPFYLFLITGLLLLATQHGAAWLSLLIMPALAKLYVWLK